MRPCGVVVTVMLVAVALFGLAAPSEGTENSPPTLPGQPGFSLWAQDASPRLLAQAQQPGAPGAPMMEEPWQFRLTLPLWAAGVDGEVRNNSIHKDFNDIIKDTDLAYAGHLEISRGPVTILGEFLVTRVTQEVPDRGVAFDFKTTIVEAALAYRLGPPPAQSGGLSFELLGGARYLKLDVELTGSSVSGEHKASKDLLDPMVGARVTLALAQGFSLWARGDVAGFNLSDNQTKITWNIVGGVDWRITPLLSVFGGWRFMRVESNAIDMHTDLSGPVVGLTLYF